MKQMLANLLARASYRCAVWSLRLIDQKVGYISVTTRDAIYSALVMPVADCDDLFRAMVEQAQMPQEQPRLH